MFSNDDTPPRKKGDDKNKTCSCHRLIFMRAPSPADTRIVNALSRNRSNRHTKSKRLCDFQQRIEFGRRLKGFDPRYRGLRDTAHDGEFPLTHPE